MSTLTDKVELEAAIAEAGLNDDEAERVTAIAAEGIPVAEAIEQVVGEREPEPAAPPEPAAAPEELGEPSDAQLKQLDKEQTRHERRVHEIMGAHVAGFEACEHCGGIGLLPPGPKPQRHEWFKPCDTCAGYGRVLTGSLRDGQDDVDCPVCGGRGYLEQLDEDGQPLREKAKAGVPVVAAPVAPVLLEPADANGGQPAQPKWGAPAWMGDPSIGS